MKRSTDPCQKCGLPRTPRKDGHLICTPCQKVTAKATFHHKVKAVQDAINAGLPVPILVRTGRPTIWGTGKSLIDGESVRPPIKNEADMSSIEIFDAIWEQNELARRPLEMNKRAGRLKAGECLYIRREVAAP